MKDEARLIFPCTPYCNIRIGVLIRVGALINKNTFERGCLFERGALIGRRVLNRIITVTQHFTALS